MLPIIAVYLYDLREVGLPSEHVLYSATVEHKPIGRKLESVLFCDALPQIGEKCISRRCVTLADAV